MLFDQAIAFLVFALVAAITPGPSNTMITATGSAVGVWRGLPCALGAAVGMASLLFCSALGLGQLVISQPMLLRALNRLRRGLPVMARLENRDFGNFIGDERRDAGRLLGRGGIPVGQSEGLAGRGQRGWHLSAGNGGNALAQAVAFGGLFFVAALPAGLVWLVLGAVVQRFLRDERSARIFNVTMGAALAASVMALFV